MVRQHQDVVPVRVVVPRAVGTDRDGARLQRPPLLLHRVPTLLRLLLRLLLPPRQRLLPRRAQRRLEHLPRLHLQLLPLVREALILHRRRRCHAAKCNIVRSAATCVVFRPPLTPVQAQPELLLLERRQGGGAVQEQAPLEGGNGMVVVVVRVVQVRGGDGPPGRRRVALGLLALWRRDSGGLGGRGRAGRVEQVVAAPGALVGGQQALEVIPAPA